MKLDLLAFAAHPDDAEISAGGTIAKSVAQGKKVGIIDLSRGELGSRGSGELRVIEADKSTQILGLKARENLKLRDGFFDRNEESLLSIIQMIRKYQPEIVLCNSISDRHPDHGRGSALVAEAAFLTGLRKNGSGANGQEQIPWRPKAVYHYIQDFYLKPDFVIDITDYFETKMDAVKTFSSQFFDPNSEEPITPISGEDFFEFLKARAMQFGRPAGMKYAEGFNVERYPGVNGLFDLI